MPPESGPTTNNLTAVAARSASDVWAVGTYATDGTEGFPDEPLVLHRDGPTWTIVPAQPLPASGGFNGVAIGSGIHSDDVWAVGSFRSGDALRPVVERWDGEAWTLESGVPDTAAALQAVATAPNGAIWSVGSTAEPDQAGRTMVLRGIC